MDSVIVSTTHYYPTTRVCSTQTIPPCHVVQCQRRWLATFWIAAQIVVDTGYANASFSPSFPGYTVIGPATSTIPVLTQVGFADGTSYHFEYTTFGQVNKVRRHEADNRLLSYVRFNLATGAQSDCPRFSEERVWAEHWNNGQQAVTTPPVSSDNGNQRERNKEIR